MQNLYFRSLDKFNGSFFANTLNHKMSFSLYFILTIFFLFTLFTVMIARSSNDNIYSDINTEEWLCNNCGFEVQVGDECIYCGALKE